MVSSSVVIESGFSFRKIKLRYIKISGLSVWFRDTFSSLPRWTREWGFLLFGQAVLSSGLSNCFFRGGAKLKIKPKQQTLTELLLWMELCASPGLIRWLIGSVLRMPVILDYRLTASWPVYRPEVKYMRVLFIILGMVYKVDSGKIDFCYTSFLPLLLPKQKHICPEFSSPARNSGVFLREWVEWGEY